MSCGRFIAERLMSEGYDLSRALDEGVSPAFLAAVVCENMMEVAEGFLGDARRAGELHCGECQEYYSLRDAQVEGNLAFCPRCGKVLRASRCGLCGEGLCWSSGYRGIHWRGFCFCAGCLPFAQAAMKNVSGGGRP